MAKQLVTLGELAGIAGGIRGALKGLGQEQALMVLESVASDLGLLAAKGPKAAKVKAAKGARKGKRGVKAGSKAASERAKRAWATKRAKASYTPAEQARDEGFTHPPIDEGL